MITEIAATDLSTVRGGLTEAELRALAAKKCPNTYERLEGKTADELTRADANDCVAEWKPNRLIRGTVERQIDDYFKTRGQ